MGIPKKISVIALSTLSFIVGAQEFVGSEKYEKLMQKKWYKEGFIVSTSSDTLKGLIKFRSNSSGELSSFWFFNEEGKKIYKEPTDVLSIKCGELKYHSHEGSMLLIIHEGESYDLVKNVTVSGAVELLAEIGLGYIGVSTNTSLATNLIYDLIPKSSMLHLFRKDSNELTAIRKKDFNNNYQEIFEGCPDVVTKIEDGTHKYYHLAKIVSEYDTCYNSNLDEREKL